MKAQIGLMVRSHLALFFPGKFIVRGQEGGGYRGYIYIFAHQHSVTTGTGYANWYSQVGEEMILPDVSSETHPLSRLGWGIQCVLWRWP